MIKDLPENTVKDIAIAVALEKAVDGVHGAAAYQPLHGGAAQRAGDVKAYQDEITALKEQNRVLKEQLSKKK